MMEIKKLLVGEIIFLFIGVTIAPIIQFNIVKASDDNDFVEVTTQICSITEGHTNIVQLTTQQAREVQQVFDELQNRLSSAESMEETSQIFNDTILLLGRYHLLPSGLNVEHAKRLVTSINQRVTPFLKKISTKFQADAGTMQNSFCYVAGNTSNTHVAKLAKRTALQLYNIIDYCTANVPLNKAATALWIICNQLSKISQMILQRNGNHYGVCIYFGNYHYYPYPNWLSPAQGWLSTDGINGKQNISGSFWGQKITNGWQPQDDWYMNYTWRGCLGFTGLIIYLGSDSAYYLGSALQVNVGTDRP
jgi:hypothetical protein